MKRIKVRNVFLMVAFSVLSVASAQTKRELVLSEVMERNLTLKSLRMMNEASSLESRTGIYLSDPLVSVAYKEDWFNDGAYTYEIEVSQDIDLSILLGRKSKVAVAQTKVSEAEYLKSQKELELEVAQLLDQWVYLGKKQQMLGQKVVLNKLSVDYYDSSLKKGESGKVEFNQSLLALADAEASSHANQMELDLVYMRLSSLNGGAPVDTAGLEYDLMALPLDFESWFARVADSLPTMQESMRQEVLSNAERKLAKAGWLPKLSVGYATEQSIESDVQGINLGFSLPLWENKNSVRSAKLKVAAAELQTAVQRQTLHDSFSQIYTQARTLEKQWTTYLKSWTRMEETRDLLSRDFQNGKTELPDYVDVISSLYDMEEKLLDMEYQYQQAKTALMIYGK